MDEDSLTNLNQQLRRLRDDVDTFNTTIDLTSEVSGVLPLANGGTETALTAPGADRIFFWDHSDLATDWLDLGTGLSISGNDLEVSGAISAYVDGQFVEATATTVRSTTNATYTKLKELSPLVRGGSMTARWQAQSGGGGETAFTKIYVNSIAVGGEKTSLSAYETEEQGLTISAGDVIQVYGKSSSQGTNTCRVKELSIITSNPIVFQEATGY